MRQKRKRKQHIAKQFISFLLTLAFVISSLSLPQGSKNVKADEGNQDLEAGIYFWHENPEYYESKPNISWKDATENTQKPIIELDEKDDGKITKFHKDRLENGTYDLNGRCYKIVIKDGITEIGDRAFYYENQNAKEYGNNKLKEIYMTNSVKTIENQAFQDCNKLETITIGDDEEESNLTTIGTSTFSGCSSLKTITIPNKVTSIGDSAFKNCTNLKKVNIASEKIAGNNIFKTVNDNSSTIDSKNVFIIDNENNEIEFILTDNNIKFVNDFKKICEGITVTSEKENSQLGTGVSYTVSAGQELDSKTTISSDLETNVEKADSLSIGTDVLEPSYQWYEVVGGTSTPISDATGIEVNLNLKDYGIYTLIREISWSGGKYKLNQSIKVTYAKEYIKYTDTNDEKLISWDDAVKMKYITVSKDGISFVLRFNNNKNPLKSATEIVIVAPDAITKVGENAFKDDTSLEKITLPEQIIEIGDSAFSGCDKLTEITLPENLKSIGASAFNACIALKTISIPDSVTSIGNFAFFNCSELGTINIGKGSQLTSIGASAFNGCQFKEITLPDGITSIGEGTFEKCNALTQITLSKNLNSIGTSAFESCTDLTKITLPSIAMSIGSKAFYGSKIATVILPADTSMGDASSMYAKVKNAFNDGSASWRLEIPVSKEVTVGGTLSLEASNDKDASYEWYQVKDGNETKISEASEANLKLDKAAFPASATPYTLIRKAEEPNSSDGVTIYHRVTLMVKETYSAGGSTILPPTTETHEHKAIVQNKKSATCTQGGYTGDTVCSVCGEMLQKGETIPATGHRLKKVKAKKATVEAAGNVEHYICENCQKLFTDETAQKEVTKEEVRVPLSLKKGEKVKKKDGISYQVIDVKRQEVAYVAPNKKKKASKISIPSKVDIGGKTYKVVRIKKNAFKNNKTVTKIVIPSTVDFIENYAFANCKNLKTLEIKTMKLNKKNVAPKAFKGIKKKVTIKVPKKKKKAYRSLFRKKGLSKKNKIKKL